MSGNGRENQPENPIGIHASVWVGGWSEPEARYAIEQSAAAGFDLIEIPALEPANINVAVTRRALEAAGLAATCSLGLGFETDVSSEDPAVVARGERVLSDALSVVRDLGGRHLCGVLASALGRYTAPATRTGRSHAVAAIRRLGERAEQAGVTVSLEIVNRYESNLFNTADEALDFIAEAGSPNVKVHLDTYHMNIEEADLAGPVRACGDQLGYVHIGANNRGGLRQGMIDFPVLFRALREINYRGPIAFESFSSAVVAQGLSSSLCIWRELWQDGAALAREARAVIAEAMEQSGS